jgi:hypothetical protein
MSDNGELLKAYAAIARREQRERVAKGLAVVKAARKKGFQVTRATIGDVELEFQSWHGETQDRDCGSSKGAAAFTWRPDHERLVARDW